MELYKITRAGKSTLINGDNILTVDYEEESQHLAVKFINGDTLTLDGVDAAYAWEIFSDEIITYDGEEETSRETTGTAEPQTNDDEEDEERDLFEEINREINILELQVQRKSVGSTWPARQLRSSADELGLHWDKNKKRLLAAEIKRVRERAYALADEAEMVALVNTIDECSKTPLINPQGVKAILRRLQESEEDLERGGRMTSALQQQIRAGKERLAWFRAKKKLDDGQVAAAGGNVKKLIKLNKEAALLIKQDWAEVFPDEEPPEV